MKGLCLKELSKTYKGKVDNIALKETSVCYHENQIIGLLGDNGAGKTTLLKSIINIVYPTKGTIYFNSKNLQTMRSKEKAKLVFFVAEGTRSLWWRLTVIENIRFMCQMMWGNWDSVKSSLDSYLEVFGLTDKKDVLVGKLSRGQQQKVCILLAVVSDSPLVIMDEPTLGLDVSSRQEIAEMILAAKHKSKTKTFIISSHDMDFVAKVADRISILKEGKLIANGTIAELQDLLQRKYTRFSIMDELNDEQARFLRSEFDIKKINKENGKLFLEVYDDLSLKNKIIDYLRNQGIYIESIQEHDGSLESLFVELQRG
ncbi:ATP-binding cassette domain-containing protein [Dethiothermospora halolimnae]|uniref:ATP-binding cassette domain-containing protein n=1 Tax=Dethiothermospora halolimnae TaxID=3114390 RepID=UPI003CCBCADC